jgi:hypothetical protein
MIFIVARTYLCAVGGAVVAHLRRARRMIGV